ncbi:PhzF family phenazine biosynthesis protein [Sphingosinicella rhizophila]|uniref:PhzF family phenazine biosynthesis protein n=1 Tax=Sphingosinicella rhizophila TaxID=3050082 RepID=A0ABU3Q592_9SPHN|nr:PhzF family phenazine biosynthesis protein [Sphingosinicella sp. GR2756]MDT9598105.1 PhzF family phenazine biosynthesis protein [Sphingosinicella sp. GR2756]
MTELRFVQVDAFAERPFAGNPAAVIPLDAWLPDDLLQAIAMENNLSETAFTVPAAGDADYELRWFTPTTEVVMCGHATLASGHVLIEGDKIRFRTRKVGILEVARQSGGYALSLPLRRAEPKPLPDVLAGLGCGEAETFWHEEGYALVALPTEEQVLALRPDYKVLAAEGDVLIIVTAPGRESDVVSRVFAPGAGIDEDPVTGSAHAVLVPYWAERLGRDEFTAYQASRRGGRISCKRLGDRAILGGGCVTVIEGMFRL